MLDESYGEAPPRSLFTEVRGRGVLEFSKVGGAFVLGGAFKPTNRTARTKDQWSHARFAQKGGCACEAYLRDGGASVGRGGDDGGRRPGIRCHPPASPHGVCQRLLGGGAGTRYGCESRFKEGRLPGTE